MGNSLSQQMLLSNLPTHLYTFPVTDFFALYLVPLEKQSALELHSRTCYGIALGKYNGNFP